MPQHVLPLLVVLVVGVLPGTGPQEEPSPPPTDLAARVLALRADLLLRARGKASQAQDALLELRRLHWNELTRLRASTRDADLAGTIAVLEHAEFVPTAAAVFTGRLATTEIIQGGVIDYRKLLATFTSSEVLRDNDGILIRGDQGIHVNLGRGSSRDTWLLDVLDREAQRHDQQALWILHPRTYRYEASTGSEAGMLLLEFTVLPASGAPLARALLAP